MSQQQTPETKRWQRQLNRSTHQKLRIGIGGETASHATVEWWTVYGTQTSKSANCHWQTQLTAKPYLGQTLLLLDFGNFAHQRFHAFLGFLVGHKPKHSMAVNASKLVMMHKLTSNRVVRFVTSVEAKSHGQGVASTAEALEISWCSNAILSWTRGCGTPCASTMSFNCANRCLKPDMSLLMR